MQEHKNKKCSTFILSVYEAAQKAVLVEYVEYFKLQNVRKDRKPLRPVSLSRNPKGVILFQ